MYEREKVEEGDEISRVGASSDMAGKPTLLLASDAAD
jgi:hypothetical protein